MGDDEARRVVRAADDSTSTNTGLTLAPHLQTFITDTFTGRPAFDAVTRSALTESGMSFTVPRMYVNAGTPNTAPTVADTNEGSAGIERVRQELFARANAICSPVNINNVLIKEFIIQ